MTFGGYPLWILLIWLFLVGAVLGSFLNVCIHRIPQREEFWASLRELWNHPSTCPYCKRKILVRDNIPILGWLLIRGRCRFCRHRVPIRYPLIELFNGLLFVAVYWLEVPAGWTSTIQDSCLWTELGPQPVSGSSLYSAVALVHWRYVYHMVLLEALMVATFIDFDRMIIPDGATLPAMAVGFLGAVLYGRMWLVPAWFQNPELLESLRVILPDWLHFLTRGPAVPRWFAHHPHWHGLLVSIAGFFVGGGIVWVVRLLGEWVLRREAMGFGDVILMALIGSFLGWQATVIIFFLAPLCAVLVLLVTVIFVRGREIPYGPYLSLATLITILGWSRIWPHVRQIFSLGALVPLLAVFMAATLALLLVLIQLLKWAVGINPYPDEEWEEVWTSADQLNFFAGSHVQTHGPPWNGHRWPGTATARGTAYTEAWRQGRTNAWQQHWQRRGS